MEQKESNDCIKIGQHKLTNQSEIKINISGNQVRCQINCVYLVSTETFQIDIPFSSSCIFFFSQWSNSINPGKICPPQTRCLWSSKLRSDSSNSLAICLQSFDGSKRERKKRKKSWENKLRSGKSDACALRKKRSSES